MKKTTNSNRQMKLNIIASYANAILVMVIGLFLVPYTLDMLGKDQFGLYRHVTAITKNLSVINLGFGTALVRYISKYRAEGDKESESNFVGLSVIFYAMVSAIIVCVGFVLAANTDSAYQNSVLSEEAIAQIPFLVRMMSAYFGIAMLGNIFTGIISGYERYDFLKYQSLIMLIIRTISCIGALLFWNVAVVLIIVDIIVTSASIIINIIFIKKNFNIAVKFKNLEKSFVAEIFGYTFFVFLNQWVATVNWSLDELLMGNVPVKTDIEGETLIGMYGISMNINNMYMVASTSIADLMLPKVTKMMVEKSSGEELTNLMIKVGRFQLMILCYLAVIFAFFGQEFIAVWVGEDYQDIANAVHTMWLCEMIIMIPFSFVLFQNTGVSILQAQNKHKFRSVVLVIVSFFNIALTVFLLPRIGVFGAAIGTAIGLLVGNVIIVNIYYHKALNINMFKFYKETIGAFLGTALFMTLACIILNKIPGISWVTLMLRCGVVLIIYAILIWVLVLNEEEKTQVKLIKDRFVKKV